MAVLFTKRVQNTPKVKAIRKRIAKKKKEIAKKRIELRPLSTRFKQLVKSESRRLSRMLKKKERSKRKKRK